MRLLTLFLVALLPTAVALAQPSPPYSGTIFIDPDIVRSGDPTTFTGATAAGRGMRTVYDRRINNWVTINAYLYTLAFSDSRAIEAQVNPEFGSEAAGLEQALFYGPFIGQLPAVLRTDIDALWIHQGTQPFGGGNRSILIHTGQSAQYIASGILEETLIHEAAHTSLDASHAAAPAWLAAQSADPTFISTYARDNPTREDIAESVLPWLAVRYRRDRITASTASTIEGTIPNRLAYFDAQAFNLSPFVGSVAAGESAAPVGLGITVAPSPVGREARLLLDLPHDGALRVDVVDGLGRTVTTLVDGWAPAGRRVVSWMAMGLPAGVYAVRVVTPTAQQTRRVTVLGVAAD